MTLEQNVSHLIDAVERLYDRTAGVRLLTEQPELPATRTYQTDLAHQIDRSTLGIDNARIRLSLLADSLEI